MTSFDAETGAEYPTAEALLSAVEPLLKGLPDKYRWEAARVRELATERLLPPLMNYVVDFLANEDGRVRIVARDVLGRLGDSTWNSIIIGLDADFDRLGRSGKPQALEVLQYAACGADRDEYCSIGKAPGHGILAILALGRSGKQSAVKCLSRILQDDDYTPSVMIAAAQALGRLGGAEAAAALVQGLGNYHRAVQREVASALIQSGDFGYQALALAQENPESEIRTAARSALRRTKELRAIWARKAHARGVSGISIGRDGNLAVSWEWMEPAKVWCPLTGEQSIEFGGYNEERSPCNVVVMPDNQSALALGGDGTLRLWDLNTGDVRRTVTILQGHHNWCLAITPEGSHFITGYGSGDRENSVNVWELETAKRMRVLDGNTGRHQAQDFSVSGAYSHTVYYYSSGGTGHGGAPSVAVVTPDGRRLVTGGQDGNIILWDLQTGEEVGAFGGTKKIPRDNSSVSEFVKGLAITPDGRRLVSIATEGVRVWDLTNRALLATLLGGSHKIQDVAITPCGRFALTASSRGPIEMWDLSTGKNVRTITEGIPDLCSENIVGATAVAVTPDGHCAITGHEDGTVASWKIDYEPI